MRHTVFKRSFRKSLHLLGLSTALSMSSFSYAGFSTSGTQLLDDNGNPFVFRGVNHAHTWYNSSTPQALADIASVGANSVRVVLSNGTHAENWGRDSAQQVSTIIEQCKQNQLVCMLEIHDSTGHPEKQGSTHMSNAIDYWLDIADALRGEEDYIIINLANEPFGNSSSASDWVNAHTDGIGRLRAAGLNHTLVVDAGNWGQDWQNVMYDNAQAVINSDPDNNLIFSVHMYEVYQDRSRVENYVAGFLNQYNVPLIVGEFGADHQGNFVDADSIMAVAEQYNIGYLGWSWSGNGSCCTALDMVNNFNVNNLTTWGERIINGSNGIRETSQIASIYGGTVVPTPTGTSTPTATPTPTPEPPPNPPTNPPTNPASVSCEVINFNSWGSGYQVDVEVSNNGGSSIDGWEVYVDFNQAPNLTHGWSADLSTSGNTVTAGNIQWNGNLAAGQSVSFGFLGNASGNLARPECQ